MLNEDGHFCFLLFIAEETNVLHTVTILEGKDKLHNFLFLVNNKGIAANQATAEVKVWDEENFCKDFRNPLMEITPSSIVQFDVWKAPFWKPGIPNPDPRFSAEF